jgi:hypothetical protein
MFRRNERKNKELKPKDRVSDAPLKDVKKQTLDELLLETIARHYEGATIHDDVVDINLEGVSIRCHVDSGRQVGDSDSYSAALFFELFGGPLGTVPIFASVSGYESSVERAVVLGGCNWACTFGEALKSALTNVSNPDVAEFSTIVDGRPFRVYLDSLDRAMSFGDDEIENRTLLARERLGLSHEQPWLTAMVLASEFLPVLSTSGITVVSSFVMDTPDERTIEIKLNGSDWPAFTGLFPMALPEPEGGVSMMRELAFLVPEAPPVLTRSSIERTLRMFQGRAEDVSEVGGWRGWRQHEGRLGEVMSLGALSELESLSGPLPDDYRTFLTEVAAFGAGPGYGLVRPVVQRHHELPIDVIVLAHAGCQCMWILRLDDERRGEVWIDAVGSDQTFAFVAASFSDWYAMWIDVAVRNKRLFTQWDPSYCASVGVFSQMLEKLSETEGNEVESLEGRLGPKSMSISSGGPYIPVGELLDPCQGCTYLAASIGVEEEVFA